MSTTVSIGGESEDGKRMVMCWKCSSGMILKDKHVVLCCANKDEVVVMSDFFSPPPGCPVRKTWEALDNAKAAAGR